MRLTQCLGKYIDAHSIQLEALGQDKNVFIGFSWKTNILKQRTANKNTPCKYLEHVQASRSWQSNGLKGHLNTVAQLSKGSWTILVTDFWVPLLNLI